MAEPLNDTKFPSNDTKCQGRQGNSGGSSFVLFVAGLLALAVSVWALAGPETWPSTSLIPFGWIVVAVAIISGLILVLSPRRRR